MIVGLQGIIILKENVSEEDDEFDAADSSRARHIDTYMSIFENAGAELMLGERSRKFPEVRSGSQCTAHLERPRISMPFIVSV